MTEILLNSGLILLFICISGVFAAAEMSLVSLRESQVRQLQHRSRRGPLIARLTAEPNRFLSAVQIGVTLAGFLSAAFGGATLAVHLGPQLQKLGLGEGLASTLALILITALISYVSIVLGELTAKRLALQRTEAFATALAPLVDFIARIGRPVIWLLGVSTNGVVRLLGGDPSASRQEVTDEEIRAMVGASQTLGVEERQIVEDVFDAGQRNLREVMIPRTEVDFLPGSMPAYKAASQVLAAPHSRYPVIGDSADDVIGFVHVRDLLDPEISTRSTPVADLARPVIMLPDTVRVLRALTEMRRVSAHLTIVLDEYGGTAGIVTMEDVVEELVGDITDEYDEVPDARPALDGARDFDGLLTLEEFEDRTGFRLPEGPYDTLAGFLVARMGHIPTAGERVVAVVERADVDGEELEERPAAALALTVAELDGRRVSVIRVQAAEPVPTEALDPAGTAGGPTAVAPAAAAAGATGESAGATVVGPGHPTSDHRLTRRTRG
ncbi:putative hemolysin [Friedmanniella endophytica]|uniref:Putative hemolysin n=1 Tax=Microlunatus kandeliicorticis TaxID=1759536 RepID=A0A7W3IQA5_9ACTN|nr:hemolysin family protein [Microlunatus kandeliicorticis]MBA8793262.1 putative hemolysin [Microlunatus kandeliicorticis]